MFNNLGGMTGLILGIVIGLVLTLIGVSFYFKAKLGSWERLIGSALNRARRFTYEIPAVSLYKSGKIKISFEEPYRGRNENIFVRAEYVGTKATEVLFSGRLSYGLPESLIEKMIVKASHIVSVNPIGDVSRLTVKYEVVEFDIDIYTVDLVLPSTSLSFSSGATLDWGNLPRFMETKHSINGNGYLVIELEGQGKRDDIISSYFDEVMELLKLSPSNVAGKRVFNSLVPNIVHTQLMTAAAETVFTVTPRLNMAEEQHNS